MGLIDITYSLGLFRQAHTSVDAEGMRLVRNTCREFMTVNNDEISGEEQQRWFSKLDHFTHPFVLEVDQQIVGYGLVRRLDDLWWVSGGLLPDFRGRGYGRYLFGMLSNFVNGALHAPCWLTVKADNLSARKVYEQLGFGYDILNSKSSKEILAMMRPA